MKFFIFGDEERFLLDRLRELNKNFDKETRIRFLRAEVKKRENILHKRNRKHRCNILMLKNKTFHKFIIGRHKRRKKLVSEIKLNAKVEDKCEDPQFSDCMDDIDEEPSEDEEFEEENVNSEKLDTNFLQLISNELSNDQTDSSDADGDKEDNDKSDKEETETSINKDDNLEVSDNKTLDEPKKQTPKGSVVGG